MTHLAKTTTIYAPIEKVFEFIDDTEKVPVYSVGVSRVRDAVRTGNGVGDRMTLTYSALGMHFDEKFTYTEYEKPNRLVSKVQGPMNGSLSINLKEEAKNQITATLEVVYEMSSALGRTVNKLLLERMNEKNLERTLENIKTMTEAERFTKGNTGVMVIGNA